jgi:hypothetical protein
MTPNDQPVSAGDLDREVRAMMNRLENMKSTLGPDYWGNEEVQGLQQELRRCLGRYGAEGGSGAHSRARQAAAYESACARLLWPGRGDD